MLAALSAGEVVSFEQPTNAAAAITKAILRIEPPNIIVEESSSILKEYSLMLFARG
jgi:hypothetical protein